MDPSKMFPHAVKAGEGSGNFDMEVLARGFSNPLLKTSDAGMEDFLNPIEESANQGGPDDEMLQEVMLETADPKVISVHSRKKGTFQEAITELKAGLMKFNLSLEDSLSESILRHTKHAHLSPTEYEVMAITVKACQENFALTSMKIAIDEITSKLKTLTSELDDASRRAKSVTHGLQTNVNLANEFTQALKTKETLSTPSTSVTPPISAEAKATEMLKLMVVPGHQNYDHLHTVVSWYLATESPQMSLETFRTLQKPQVAAFFKKAVERYKLSH